LIVDQSDESREVLRTVLERRGVSILEARRGEEGLEILQDQRPDVVVVDLDGDQERCDSLESAYGDASCGLHTSLVLLGRVNAVKPPPGGSQVISKPYHYGPLIRTIEQLLERH
jgi:CheY-like chemotaxis protein